jgi:hypothetical protein
LFYYFLIFKLAGDKMKKKTIPKALRINVWHTHIGDDKGKSKCLCCDINEITQMNFECGHIISESDGGETIIDNLLPICSICNKSMGKNNLNLFREQIKGGIPFYDKNKQNMMENILLFFNKRKDDIIKNGFNGFKDHKSFLSFCSNIGILKLSENIIDDKNHSIVEIECKKCKNKINDFSFINTSPNIRLISLDEYIDIYGMLVINKSIPKCWWDFSKHLTCLVSQDEFIQYTNKMPEYQDFIEKFKKGKTVKKEKTVKITKEKPIKVAKDKPEKVVNKKNTKITTIIPNSIIELRNKAKNLMLEICKCSYADNCMLNKREKENQILSETYKLYYECKNICEILGDRTCCHKKCGDTLDNISDKTSYEINTMNSKYKDLYLQFLNENTEESMTHIKTSDLYEYFKGWFKNNNPNTKIPSNREFIANIKKNKIVKYVKINKSTRYGIKNLKIIGNDNEI